MRRNFTQANYDALVVAFRESPGKYSEVAARCGVYRGTARKAWEDGWPERAGWIAIRELFKLEQEQTRQALAQATSQRTQVAQEEQQKIRAAAAQDAVNIGIEEVRVVRASQVNAKAALAVANAALQGAYKQLSYYKEYIDKMPEQELRDKVKDPTFMTQVFRHARITAYIGKTASEVAYRTMEMERVRTGRPVAVIGVEMIDMTPDQAMEELDSARAALEEARDAGLLVGPPDAPRNAPEGAPVPIKAMA